MLYGGIYAAGAFALVERMVVSRLTFRARGGSVVAVCRHGDRFVVLDIAPDRALEHRAGQFVELHLPASGERPHPFSIASAPGAATVQVAIQATGAGTRRIVEGTRVGDRVRLSGVRGTHRHDDAGPRQVWVAAGIGITPFVSWVRAQGADNPGRRVDLIWSHRGFTDLPFVDELVAAARASTWLQVHLRDTSVDARLTAADVVAAGGGDVSSRAVLICGSPALAHDLEHELARLGLPRTRIRAEAFSFR